MLRIKRTLLVTGLMILFLSVDLAFAGCGNDPLEGTSEADVAVTSPTTTNSGPISTTTSSSSVEASTITAVVVTTTEAAESVIVISGPARLERPEGRVLFTKVWGSEPDQVGHRVWEQGMPSHEPILVAVSPDENTIAVGDYANRRVQLFARDGTLLEVIPYAGTGALADIAYDHEGRLFALVGNDVLELPTTPGGEVVTSMTYPWDTFPCELESGESPGGFQMIYSDSEPTWLLITDPTSPSERRVRFSSSELPLSEFHILGYDQSGNCCVMIRIYKEAWEGTESWYYTLVSPYGECLGQVRLPLDFWAGGSCTVTPSGTILELRSVESGIIVTEHELR